MSKETEYCQCCGDCEKCHSVCVCAECNDCQVCRDKYDYLIYDKI